MEQHPITSDAEIVHYDRLAQEAADYDEFVGRLRRVQMSGTTWATPMALYLDTQFDSVSQEDIYRHVSDLVSGGTFLQIGGAGSAACKAILGGAARAILVTPSQGELDLTLRVATELGIADQFDGMVAFGEKLPIETGAVDVVITEGCLHHMDTMAALTEAKRVLRTGGKFGAFDPWHARLYDIGIRVFGKRDRGVDCRPLDAGRIAPLAIVFSDSEIRLHGALFRYLLIAANKLGIKVSRERVHSLILRDDRLTKRYEWLRRNGSTVAVIATKV
ncbi:MAG: methyltransferase domain-containing protein [Pseudonocardiales bacterium]